MDKKWVKNTGEIFALFFLFLGILRGDRMLLIVSLCLLSLTAFIPFTLYPLAFIWFKLVKLLGFFMPKIFFGVIFFVVITPVGLIRKMFKKDSLLIKNQNTRHTAFFDRNHIFTKEDLIRPY